MLGVRNMAVFSTLLFIVSIYTLFPSSLSRVLTETTSHSDSTTIVFDVSASNKRAQNAISFQPQSFNQIQFQVQPALNSSSSSLSMTLQPRLAFEKHPFKDYESLVQSRLARDAARVKSLNHNLQLSLNAGENKDNPMFQPEDLSTPLVSGKSQGSGEYFARFGVGQPSKLFYIVPDTGSDVTWLQCQPCQNCYEQTDPIFDPSSSSSYTSLSCDSQQCQALDGSQCQDAKCLYQVRYGDGSFTTGEFATETLSFGNSDSVKDVAIGCGHDNEGLFVGAAGLMGLGGGPLSFSSQIKASSFSYCLVDRNSDSSSTLDFNSVQSGDSISSPLLKNNRFGTYRYIGVSGLSVGGRPLSIPSTSFAIDESGQGGIIVDSGTTVTRLPTAVYESLRDAFKNLTGDLPPAQGLSPFDTCYDLSSKSEVTVPTVSIDFSGGKSLQLPANNYLILLNSAGTFCLAFLPTTSSLSIIGNFQQQGFRVNYDLANSAVGFSANQC